MAGITALYERLSREDEMAGESSSIVNQKRILEETAVRMGFRDLTHYTDDGVSGTCFERKGWKRLLGDIESGRVGVVMVKDLSRLGRNYLEVGYYMDVVFREKGIRFIAVQNGVDSMLNDSGEFVPFINLMNEWYARDCSRKMRTTLRIKDREGLAVASRIPYGYKKDPANKGKWVVDVEAAEVVRRMFALAGEGLSCKEIARIFTEEGVVRPAVYLKRSRKDCSSEEGCKWRAVSVRQMLSNPAYLGNTYNFRTYTVSFRDKKRKVSPPERVSIHYGTHEALVDQVLWEKVQRKGWKHEQDYGVV